MAWWLLLYGPAVLIATWSMAAFVYFLQPTLWRSRFLAVLLFIEGVGWGAPRLTAWTTDPDAGRGLRALETVSDVALPWLYLLFLGSALDTPLVKPFRTLVGRWILVGIAVAFEVWAFAQPALFFRTGSEEYRTGHLWMLTFAGVIFLFAFVAAAHAYLRTEHGSTRRIQARAYMIAFGMRDLLLGPFLFAFSLPWAGVTEYRRIFTSPVDWPIVVEVVFVAILGYAILKYQLFDIDLKLKVSIQRSTIVGFFAITFIVVQQIVENFASAQLGIFVGALASGALLLVVHPLQRIATRVSDVAMPNVQPGSDYLAYRRLELYRAALEGAMEDGVVSLKENRSLERLREKLGIPPKDARALENDVVAQLRPKQSTGGS